MLNMLRWGRIEVESSFSFFRSILRFRAPPRVLDLTTGNHNYETMLNVSGIHTQILYYQIISKQGANFFYFFVLFGSGDSPGFPRKVVNQSWFVYKGVPFLSMYGQWYQYYVFQFLCPIVRLLVQFDSTQTLGIDHIICHSRFI